MEQLQNPSPVRYQQPQQPQQEEMMDIKDIFFLCLNKWYWFVLSVFICLLGAMFYLLRTPAVYTRSAEVQIKTDQRGRTTSDISQFSDLGLFSNTSTVYNEIKAFGSYVNMMEVVKRLHLDMNYTTAGRFHDNTLYGHSLPVTVELLDIAPNQPAAFLLDVKGNGTYRLSEFIVDGEPVNAAPVIGVFADTLSTPMGNVVVNPTVNFVAEDYPSINVRRTSFRAAASRYGSALNVSLSDKQSQVILLTANDISTERAEDVLNALVAVYNENWVADKNQIAVSTSAFINERLSVIENELANVDSDISSYKSENLVPDVQAASNLYMSQSNEINSQIVNLNNQLYMTKYIRDYLSNSANKNQVLPANAGISNSNIESQISEYNRQMLQRNNLASSSSESNVLVIDADNALESLRAAIITSVDNQILALNNQINSLQTRGRQATARIAASPTQAKYLLSVERQQSVKEALYLFLLQKREENELSQAFTAYNTRVIDPPHGSTHPSSPRRNTILLMAFMLGLAIPFGIIYVFEVMNGKVRGKSDLKPLTMPFAGEIPLAFGKDTTAARIRKTLKKDKQTFHASELVVRTGSRDMVNEAFRVLRTNVEFMMRGDDSKVLALTSFNPGSGKSFIAANLAMVLAVKGKKVIAVDCDLRHGSLSNYAGRPKNGFSEYLSGQVDSISSVICHMRDNENFDVLPIGSMPPNPTELVADPRFQQALDELKKTYDYILLDCPPVDLVADAQIINQSADRTLFILRAGLCDRSFLAELEDFYQRGRFKNLSVILNGTEIAKAGFSGYKYGYRYGYGYGSYMSTKKDA